MNAQTTRPVVVGYDDSPDGEIALEWAVREAERLDRPLKVVVARGMLWSTAPGFGPAAPWPEDLDRETVVRARERVATLSPTIEILTESVVGTPAAVLVTSADRAEMVVVGRHHHSVLGELVEGSTSAQVAAHATCPVVVVDRPAASDPHAPIVVAVDGSSPNDAALAFAFERAAGWAHRSSRSMPGRSTCPTPSTPPGSAPSTSSSSSGTTSRCSTRPSHRGPRKFPDVELRTVLRRNLPVEAVLEHSEGAQLIVVGSRGHGGFVGLLIGSVSQGLLHHDRPCPIAVIHAERARVVMDVGAATDHSGLRVMGTDECLERLGSTVIGRVAFLHDGEVVLLPVHHVMHGSDVCFRTSGSSKIEAAADHDPMSYEVDDYDVETRSGWSVTVTGRPRC